MRFYEVFHPGRLRNLFTVLFIVFPVVMLIALLATVVPDWKYSSKTVTRFMTPEQLGESPLTEPEYVKLLDFCFHGDYAQEVHGTRELFYYLIASCDSTDTLSPVILLRMEKAQHRALWSENEEDYPAVLELLEGKLVRGFTGDMSTYRYLRRMHVMDKSNVYMLYAGVTPAKAFKSLWRRALVMASVMTAGIVLLYFLRRFFTAESERAAQRKKILEDWRKNY